MKLNGSPKNDGFRMPGEFEPHSGSYIIWPERPDNWRNGAKPAQEVFLNVINAIAKYESITVCVNERQYLHVLGLVQNKNIKVVEMSNNDSWIRDCGATFVVNGNGEMRGVDWHFNAWGGLVDGLYFPWDKDDAVASKMCELERVDRYRLDEFVLEGGSIHADGEGTLLVTEECLLSEGRNPHLTKEEIENTLKEYLNVEKILWIPKGIYNDETNGHVDNICNFVRPGVVVLAWCEEEEDPQYEISKKAYDYLSAEVDAKGRKLEIHKMLVPSPILITKEESLGVDAVDGTLPRNEGDRMAASYVNYYTVNNAIILPVFGDANDEKAIELLSKLYPNRTIETVYAREILLGGGNVHCITQQVPAHKS